MAYMIRLNSERGDKMQLLAIDTSSELLSVAIQKDQQLIATSNELTALQHGVALLPTIANLLTQHQLQPHNINGIVVGIGPGSYTGLRIGLTAAKTWGSSLNIPVYPVSSLAVMASVVERATVDTAIIPIVDARRLSAYTALYTYTEDHQLQNQLTDTHADWQVWLQTHQAYLANYQKIILVGYKITEFAQLAQELLTNIEIEVFDDVTALPCMERAFTLIQQPVEFVDQLAPNYTQLTLAEREWLSTSAKGVADDEMVDTTIQ